MNDNDIVWLRHIIDAAETGLKIAAETSREQLRADITRQLALSKLVELIGECANKVTLETKTALPQIEWRRMIGMRNILVHDYFNMQTDILWETIDLNFPVLIRELRSFLPPISTDPKPLPD